MTAKDELEKLDREWMDEKERHGSVARLQLQGYGSVISIIAGIGIVNFWILDLGPLARRPR